MTGQLRISTHAPRVGSDPQEIMLIINEYEFQLTLPVWGATDSRKSRKRIKRYFNSRSPCGERPQHTRANHTKALFQLTLPVWGATRKA